MHVTSSEIVNNRSNIISDDDTRNNASSIAASENDVTLTSGETQAIFVDGVNRNSGDFWHFDRVCLPRLNIFENSYLRPVAMFVHQLL